MEKKEPLSGIALVVAIEKRNDLIRSKIRELTDTNCETFETELLMPLWKELGDHAPSYFSAMSACSAFVAIRKAAAEAIAGLPQAVATKVFDSVGHYLIGQAESYQKEIALKEQILRDNPLPIDNA